MLQKNNNKAGSLDGDAITVLFITHVVLPNVLKAVAGVMDKFFEEAAPASINSIGSDNANESLDALVGTISSYNHLQDV